MGTGCSSNKDFNWEELRIETHDLHDLGNTITEDEVWAAIKEMPSDKAPGPDGFTGVFFKKCWGIIKLTVMRVIQCFDSLHTSNLHWLNSANVVLLPKKEGAEGISDYRPISLIHAIARIIAKILSLRLAPHMDCLVSNAQSAFIKRRSIHDNLIHFIPSDLLNHASNSYARVYDTRKCKSGGSSDFAQPSDCYCPPHLIGNKNVGITGLAFSHQSELLVSYNDENIYLFPKNGGLGPDPKSSVKIGGGEGSNSIVFASGEDVDRPAPQVYVGHRNCETVKGVTFIGPNHEYVASGSDCGRLFIWRKRDGKFLRAMEGDECIVNCIEPHPHAMTIASSGIDNDVKLWTPSAVERAQVVNVEELKPRKRKAKLWQFALPEELVWHVLASRRRQPAAGEDSSEDLEDNTELLNLVLRATNRDNLSDESDEDEETSDGSGE
ncbi:DDB1- and CUL4-associated factor 8 [Triticum aestivum]|uniref:DDB1- and CUL4-associated factor 8 n=1 Tax=Triticum aestivum TaxID=4565 RepID=UPI001D02AA7E|nr:DDB1- and CUL4-associated factor 8-like [Triticum aestivum]